MRRLTPLLIATLLAACGGGKRASGNGPPSTCAGSILGGDHPGDFGCYAAARYYTKGPWSGNSLVQALNTASERTQARPAGVTDLGIRVELAGEPVAGVYSDHSMPETRAYVDLDDGRVFDALVAMTLTLERVIYYGQETSSSMASRVFGIEGSVAFTVAGDGGARVSVSARFASSAGANTHAISGAVTGTTGVTVTATAGGLAVASALTEASGGYALTGLADGGYRLAASKFGYAFVPQGRDVTVAGADLAGQDFAGDLVRYSVCGTVAGGAGATVTATWDGAVAATTTVDGQGSYCLAGLTNGLYTVAPGMAGYSFSPPLRQVAVSGADVAGKNFTASVIRYAISGTVTGAAYATVILTANGADVESTTTDAAGRYVFADLPGGSYAVRPNADGYAFNPSRRDLVVSGADVAGQDFAAGQWRWENPLPLGNTLNGVWGSGPSDVWAVGNGGTILHWDGAAWTRVASGSTADLHGVSGSAANDVWAVGAGGITLHWSGSAWAKVASGTTLRLDAVWATGGEAWAVGVRGTILRWDGSAWQDAGMNADSTRVTTRDLYAISGSSPSDVWAVGQMNLTVDPATRRRTVLHWDGNGWTWGADPYVGWYGGNGSGVDVADVWAGAPGVFYLCQAPPNSNTYWSDLIWTGPCLAVGGAGNGPQDVWLVGSAGYVRRMQWYGTYQFSYQDFAAVTTNDLRAVWSSGPNDTWAVGVAGTILHWDGAAWTNLTTGPANALTGIHGTAANDAWAVGARGTALHWDGAAWTRVATGSTVNLNDVWSGKVEGADDVWAVGPRGVTLHRAGSTWTFGGSGGKDLNAIWGTGPHALWVVGASGTILHGNGATWTPVASGTSSTLHGVWGSAANDVWAVGAGGTILRWQGGGWIPVPSGTAATLRSVWGAEANDVWAVGDGGVIVHWDGSGWTTVSSSISNDLTRVWGSWTGDVWAVGSQGMILRWDGASWNAVASGTGNALRGIWGSGPTGVHAVGDGGTILGWR